MLVIEWVQIINKYKIVNQKTSKISLKKNYDFKYVRFILVWSWISFQFSII